MSPERDCRLLFVDNSLKAEVKSVPGGEVTVIASSSRCPVSGIRIEEKRIWGLQPYFEIGIAAGMGILRDTLGEERVWSFVNANPPKDSGRIYRIMSAFLSL